MAQYFHLTIGPVQSFVAQARRSKDLWSGSFLLSWLSAVAIVAVREQHPQNSISFPQPDENFIAAITGSDNGQYRPKQGGIPNRFKGVMAEVESDFPAHEVVLYVRRAWEALAEHVWEHDLVPFFAENPHHDMAKTRTVWDRQVQNLWEISWVLTPDATTSNLLDRRKNWRNSYAPEEPGTKCMMMAGWQELSGHATSAGQRDFWHALRQHINKTDLEEGEQLSALAFIKRRFARYFHDFTFSTAVSGFNFDEFPNLTPPAIYGWSFKKYQGSDDYDPNHVPSIPYLAAVPFVKEAFAAISENEDLKTSYEHFIEKAKAFGLPSKLVEFKHLDSQAQALGLHPDTNCIDGQAFFPDALADTHEQKARAVNQALSSFVKDASLTAPTPFYAILLMDGDSLGVQMSDQSKQSHISHALNAFTKGVQSRVNEHNGFLIYAGGDDVLAFMPIDSVVACAHDLEQFYGECFAQDYTDNVGNKTSTRAYSTLSGAVQIAHMRTPLMKILQQAHGLLDDVAKDQTGRHALAIRINKPAGIHAQWSMPFTSIKASGGDLLQEAIALFTEQKAHITQGLIFKMIDVMEIFATTPSANKPSQSGDSLLLSALRSEFIHSGEQLNMPRKDIEKLLPHLELLLRLCETPKREFTAETQQVKMLPSQSYNADALKVLRFFATKGQERSGAQL